MSTEPDSTHAVTNVPVRLQQALRAVDECDDAIVDAKLRKGQQQELFAHALATHLAELAADGGIEAGAPLLGTLYWDHANVRIKDLQTASGLSGDALRRLVGPREVEVDCRTCGSPTTFVKRGRTTHVQGECTACQSGSQENLDDLFDFLADVLGRRRCDHRLTLSRAWATHNGRDPAGVAAELERRGGYCDCEVLMNVAPDARWAPGIW